MLALKQGRSYAMLAFHLSRLGHTIPADFAFGCFLLC
jgi:hypothetical protein